MSGTSASPQFKGAMKDVTYVAGPGYKEPRQDWYYYNTYFIIILFLSHYIFKRYILKKCFLFIGIRNGSSTN